LIGRRIECTVTVINSVPVSGGTAVVGLKVAALIPSAAKGVKLGVGVSDKIINRANHIFGPKSLEKHALGDFLKKFGGNKVKAFQSLERATQKHVTNNLIDGVFEVSVKVRGVGVNVRGRVVDGNVNIGTAFVP